MAFTTGTGNKEAAARIAAGIYTDLLTLGIEGTLAKHRAQKTAEKPAGVAGVGDWIAAARAVATTNPATFACYAASLRKIAGDILRVKPAISVSGRGRVAPETTARRSTRSASKFFPFRRFRNGGSNTSSGRRIPPRNVRG